MNNFQKSEEEGRSLLKSLLDQAGATDQQPTQDKFDPVDYYFTYKDKKVVAEVKVRNEKYLNCETHIIEDKKLKSLLQAKEDNNCDCAYYINFIGDTAFWYTTSTIQRTGKADNMLCNKTTATPSNKISKEIIYIPTSEAQVYVFKNGKWAKK